MVPVAALAPILMLGEAEAAVSLGEVAGAAASVMHVWGGLGEVMGTGVAVGVGTNGEAGTDFCLEEGVKGCAEVGAGTYLEAGAEMLVKEMAGMGSEGETDVVAAIVGAARALGRKSLARV